MSLLWRHSRDTASLETSQTLDTCDPSCNFTADRHRSDDGRFGGEGGLFNRIADRKDNRTSSGFLYINGLVHSKVEECAKNSDFVNEQQMGEQGVKS